jgi:hypothetical protein
VTPAQFLQNFPEFGKTSPNLVEAKLVEALVDMGGPDLSVWPPLALEGATLTKTDYAQGYLAAHLLQTSPFGTATRLDPKGTDGRSAYLERYEIIALAVSGPVMIVAGVGTVSPFAAPAGLTLEPGTGTVALVNGSLNVTFSVAQVLPAGTVMAFIQGQPGALYALAANLAGTAGVLTAPYTGPTTASSRWNFGAL